MSTLSRTESDSSNDSRDVLEFKETPSNDTIATSSNLLRKTKRKKENNASFLQKHIKALIVLLLLLIACIITITCILLIVNKTEIDNNEKSYSTENINKRESDKIEKLSTGKKNGIVRFRNGLTWSNRAWGDNNEKDSVSGMKVVFVDLFDAEQSTIDKLKADDHIVVCYISTGTIEDWRDDYKENKADWDKVKGKKMEEWDGEWWLDIRKLDQLKPLMTARFRVAQNKKCDAVEPDNVDCYQNKCVQGQSENALRPYQLMYNKWQTEQIHALGMSVGLKNSLDLVKELVEFYDFAINEECVDNEECELLNPFYKSGKAIFGTEYGGKTSEICDTGESNHIMMKYNFGSGWKNCFKGVTPLPDTIYGSGQGSSSSTSEPSPTTPGDGHGLVRFKNGLTWSNRAWGDNNEKDSVSGMKVVFVDLFDAEQSTIDKLKADDHIVVCYISTGTIEDWRDDYKENKADWDKVKGKKMEEWDGEWWLDIRKLDQLKPLMTARFRVAQNKKCDAVEPDNVDCYQNKCVQGQSENALRPYQLMYNKWQTEQIHALGMSVGLKNSLDLVKELVEFYDFAINEECVDNEECELLNPFYKSGKAIFGTEYGGKTSEICDTGESNHIMMKYNFGSGWKNCFKGVTPLPDTIYGSGQGSSSSTSEPSPTTPGDGHGLVRFKNGLTWSNRAWGDNNEKDSVSGMKVVFVDLFDAEQSTIDKLKADDHIVVCYISTGTIEDWRDDYKENKADWDKVKGKKMEEWDGEWWLDIRKLDQLKPLMTARFRVAQNKKCDAVEPDNVDCYQNKCVQGQSENALRPYQLMYNKWQTEQIHALGMSVGLKNSLDLVKELVEFYDFAINEECVDNEECELLNPFYKSGKAIFGTEYGGKTSEICDTGESNHIMMKYNFGSGWKNCFKGVTPLPDTIYGSGQGSSSSTSEPSPTTPGDGHGLVRFKNGLTWSNRAWGDNNEKDSVSGMKVVFVDLFDAEQKLIDQYLYDGHIVVCYFSAGTIEPRRGDYLSNKDKWNNLKVKKLSAYNEYYLDITKLNKLQPLISPRFKLAKSRGCQAVSPANVDCFANSCINGEDIDSLRSYQLKYNIWLALEAHQLGLSIGLLNALELSKDLQPYYDFAVSEACVAYGECRLLRPFIENHKTVFGTETEGVPDDICAVSETYGIMLKYNFGQGWKNCFSGVTPLPETVYDTEEEPVFSSTAPTSTSVVTTTPMSSWDTTSLPTLFPSLSTTASTTSSSWSSPSSSTFSLYPSLTVSPTPTSWPSPSLPVNMIHFPVGLTWACNAFGSKGKEDASSGMKVVVLDLFNVPQIKIDKLKENGHIIVCSVSVGTIDNRWVDYQNNKSAWDSVKGLRHESLQESWWIDITKLYEVKPLLRKRFEVAKLKSCDAILPDNVDCYQNNCVENKDESELFSHQLEFNKWQATTIHSLGLRVGLKNVLNLTKELIDYYDFAVSENCVAYKDCDKLQLFYDSNKAIFGVEYEGDVNNICATAEKNHIRMKYNFGQGWVNCFKGSYPLPETEYTSDQNQPALPTWSTSFPTSTALPIPTSAGIARFLTGYTWTNNAWGEKNYRDLTDGMKVVFVDLFDTSKERIEDLKRDNVLVTCYLSTGTVEKWREDFLSNKSQWKEVEGQEMEEWPGESWLKITELEKLKALMLPRFKLARHKLCDAVEPDNVDCFQNDCIKGKSESELRPYQIKYNKWQVFVAHSLGMAIGLKNSLDLIEDMEKDYDFAINEECVKYNDCAKLLPFYKSGKAIFGTEYDGDGPHICKTAEKFHIKMKYNFGDGWINCFPGTRPLPETEYYPEKVETGTPKPTLPPPTTEYCGNCTNPPNQYCYLPEGECNQEGNDCEYFKVPPGAACLNVEKGASRVCNKNGECVDLCESVTCNSPPNKECFAMLGLCNPLTGKCTYDQHQEGTPCIDPRVDLPGRCNQDGLCLHLCDPMANTMCSLPPSACYVDEGVCEEATGTCHYDKRPLGHSCITEDNQAGWCDYSGRCLSPCGILGCRTPPNRQCYVANGQCESWSGACHYDRHPQGTLCQISENEVGQCNDYGECVNVCKDVKCLSPPHPQCYLSTGVCNIMTGRCGYYRRISAEC